MFFNVNSVDLSMTIKDNVERLLANDEKCRNEDLYLILKFWQQYDGLKVDLSIFDSLTSSESIRRARQQIQNDDEKYPPTDPVVRAYRERKRGQPYP